MAKPNAISNAVGYAKFQSLTSPVIRVYNEAGNVIETHEHKGGGRFETDDALALDSSRTKSRYDVPILTGRGSRFPN